MFGKLSVALLIAATPAVAAAQATPEPTAGARAETPAKQAYKTKKICRSIEVVGSSIPRRACTTKRVPIEPQGGEPEQASDQAEQRETPDDG